MTDIVERLRDQCCRLGHDDHGHTNCWLFGRAAAEIVRLRAENTGRRSVPVTGGSSVSTTQGETMSKTITVDGVEYAPVADQTPTVRRIVIAQRGWVFVGTWREDGDEITLTDASVIRVWGTTEGVGQLALTGPTPSTKLDPCGPAVRLHRLAIVATLDVVGEW